MKIETKTGVYTQDGIENTFSFVTNLSAYDKMRFVSNITDYIIVEDGYYSIVKDLFFDFMIINMFTDVDLSYLDDVSNSVNEIEKLVNDTEIVDVVKANMVDGLLDELTDGVNDNLAYRSGVNKNDFTTTLSHLIKTVENRIVGIDMDAMMNLAANLSGVTDELTADKIIEAYSKRNFKIVDEGKEK